jgi:hypothetical protein
MNTIANGKALFVYYNFKPIEGSTEKDNKYKVLKENRYFIIFYILAIFCYWK